jgi:hypothetical protein
MPCEQEHSNPLLDSAKSYRIIRRAVSSKCAPGASVYSGVHPTAGLRRYSRSG